MAVFDEPNKARQYQFGFGDPPANATFAIGGAGPMIINKLPYDSVNAYKPDTATAVANGAPVTGPPGKFAGDLLMRSNSTYAGQEAKPIGTGKTILAYSTMQDRLIVIVQANGARNPASFDTIRDNLVSRGVDNAIFLDGSDSSMLVTHDKIKVPQGTAKSMTNTIGIGFKVDPPPVTPPKPKVPAPVAPRSRN
jgi:hypothetical protein